MAKTKEKDSENIGKAIKEIRKRFGDEAIMMLDEKPPVDVDAFSTGSMALDHALGIGGFPRGRIVEVYGPESSGKTTLALHVIAQAQKRGMVCAFIDAEHSMDPLYAKNLGVDTSKLMIAQPMSGEEGMQITDQLVRAGDVGVIVVDSVAALTPKAELEGEIGDTHVGRQARLMSQSLRVLTASIDKSKVLVIFLNQLRANLAAAQTWGAPLETTAGGKALKFYASVRVEIKKIETIKKGEQLIGSKVRAKVVKNKVAAPFGVAEFDVLYNEGISRTAELLNLGEKYGVLEKSTGGYMYKDQRIGRGYETARAFLGESENTLLAIEIQGAIFEAMKK